MGFASFFEDIVEKNPSIVRFLLPKELLEGTVSHKTDEVPQPIRNLPPLDFIEMLSPILTKDGVPGYIVPFYVNYVYQLVTKCETIDQIFDDFTQEAIPLITENLKKGDVATTIFARKYLLGSIPD